MSQEIKNFTIYSLRYQILLAQRVANICNEKVYIFDSTGFFDNDTETVTIDVSVGDSIRTLFKKDHRAVLNVAVKEAFSTNEKLFLQFVDQNVLEKDNIGLYVVGQNCRRDDLSRSESDETESDETESDETESDELKMEKDSEESENLKKDLKNVQV
jgi:hypothetical protein